MKSLKKGLCLLIVLTLVLSAAGCGSGSSTGDSANSTAASENGPQACAICISETGLASWEAVEGAVGYAYSIVDKDNATMGEEYTEATSVQLPEGFCIHMQPVFADGSRGHWQISGFYGTPTALASGQEPEQAPSGPAGTVQGEMTVTIDDRGYASWEAVEGASGYAYTVISSTGLFFSEGVTGNTYVRVPLDHYVDVRAILPGSDAQICGSSEVRGGTLADPNELELLMDRDFTVRKEDVQRFELIGSIDFSSVQTLPDGSVTFTAQGPHGPMRFQGTGITVADGEITLQPGGSFFALDSIGRICAYKAETGSVLSQNSALLFTGGYSFDGRTSVASVHELFQSNGQVQYAYDIDDPRYDFISMLPFQPNMIGFRSYEVSNTEPFSLRTFTVFYDEATFATPVKELHLSYEFYRPYTEGDLYDPSREVYDPSRNIYTFYLMVMPQLLDERQPLDADFMTDLMPYNQRAVTNILPQRYTIGALRDPQGNELDKATAPLTPGTTLDITLAGSTYAMELPVLELRRDARTLHELTPYAYYAAEGDITALVVPVRWPDCPGEATDALLELIRAKIGRVVHEDGTVTDYTGGTPSVSSYYEQASYGKLSLTSFVTDWVDAPYPYSEALNFDLSGHTLPDELMALVRERYPDMDWSRFDADGDGLLDAVYFVGASPKQDAVIINGVGGAVHVSQGYTAERAGLPGDPQLKDFTFISGPMAQTNNVFLHETTHHFGLIDYYDVTYSGISALGSFDMSVDNAGDWNPYSKYAVGWIEPEVVTGLEPGASVELTIGALWATGDAVVIPAADADFHGPFGEYILVDLFDDGGLNAYDAEAHGLGGVTGVRIYHVDAAMERRVLTDIYGDTYVIGTPNVGNAYSADGRYHIELLQKGGINTFTTGGRTQLLPQDLFAAGDSFRAEQYSQFLPGGRMEDGSAFGYEITVVAIDTSGPTPTATIRITRI